MLLILPTLWCQILPCAAYVTYPLVSDYTLFTSCYILSGDIFYLVLVMLSILWCQILFCVVHVTVGFYLVLLMLPTLWPQILHCIVYATKPLASDSTLCC